MAFTVSWHFMALIMAVKHLPSAKTVQKALEHVKVNELASYEQALKEAVITKCQGYRHDFMLLA